MSLAGGLNGRRYVLAFVLFLCLVGLPAFADDAGDFSELSIEELLNVEVSSVAKKTQRLAVTPAAVYVISANQIMESGVTHVAEALRLAPGISVGRISANRWSVVSRGVGGRFSNKLLVLVDGRSVYNDGFAGVHWESINVPVEEIDRIEVIRGAGSSVWRGNAVNGTINIITKQSSDVLGSRSVVAVGTDEKRAYFSHGHQLEGYESGYGRYYVHAKEFEGYELENGGYAGDDWAGLETGFRYDVGDFGDGLGATLQGGVSRYSANQKVKLGSYDTFPVVDENIETDSAFLLGRLSRTNDSGKHSYLKFYYDYRHRDEVFAEHKNHIFDVEYLENISFGSSHDIVWGVGYRGALNISPGSPYYQFSDQRSFRSFGSLFFQDEITLIEDELWLTVGSKLEHNPDSGFEFQPTVRALWAIKPGHNVWGAVSRVVRLPGLWERGGYARFHPGTLKAPPLPLLVELQGNTDFEPEELTATELGYRYRPKPNMYIDLALFYNHYKKLRGYKETNVIGMTQVTQELYLGNAVNQNVYGAELSVNLELSREVRAEFTYAGFYNQKADVQPGWITLESTEQDHQELSMRVQADLNSALSCHAWLTYNTSLVVNSARTLSYLYTRDDYVNFHAGMTWAPRDDLEISFEARNLLHNGVVEHLMEGYIGINEVPTTFTVSIRHNF